MVLERLSHIEANRMIHMYESSKGNMQTGSENVNVLYVEKKAILHENVRKEEAT